MTNAERIQHMTDDDLCNFISWYGCPLCYLWNENPRDCVTMRVKHFKSCLECWRAWLQEEAEAENDRGVQCDA